jgi:hypothetical protein
MKTQLISPEIYQLEILMHPIAQPDVLPQQDLDVRDSLPDLVCNVTITLRLT